MTSEDDVRGASLRGLALRGKTPAMAHEALMTRGFVARCLPLLAPTTRSGARRFFTIDGDATHDVREANLAGEWTYAHEDGGVVRIFPFGHPSCGLGGVVGPSARFSIRAGPDLSLDSEICAVGPAGRVPRTVHAAHGLACVSDPEEESDAGLRHVRDTWFGLRRGPPVVLPLEDWVGLRLTRTILPTDDFEVVGRRAARLAASHGALAVDKGTVVHHLFTGPARAPYVASLTVDRGAQVLGVDPIGLPGSVERLQRFLRLLLGGTRYRVLDDATGEDVTTTAVRCPSFLVAPTRQRPALYGIAE